MKMAYNEGIVYDPRCPRANCTSKKVPRRVISANQDSSNSARLTFQRFNPLKERETLTVEMQAERGKVRPFEPKKGKGRYVFE